MNRNFTKRKNLLKPKNKVAKLPKEETLRTIIDYSKSTKYKKSNFLNNLLINLNQKFIEKIRKEGVYNPNS